MPKIYERAKNIPGAEESRRTYILDTAQNHGNNCFSACVRQCNIDRSVVHGEVYLHDLYASGWFVWMKNVRPVLLETTLKNI